MLVCNFDGGFPVPRLAALAAKRLLQSSSVWGILGIVTLEGGGLLGREPSREPTADALLESGELR